MLRHDSSALVKSGVDKVIFVGSPQVGVIVAKAAADNLTPVVLELGGKVSLHY
jgi:aldehyde dehydrogenase (NAD+)